uniref:Uncharacterized protein n=1 Tax=Monodelphis domestica TaxID=13616 RepID=A0A5F8GJ28_MONDO
MVDIYKVVSFSFMVKTTDFVTLPSSKNTIRHCSGILCEVKCSEFQDLEVFCTRESNPHYGCNDQNKGNKCKAVKSCGKLMLKHQENIEA